MAFRRRFGRGRRRFSGRGRFRRFGRGRRSFGRGSRLLRIGNRM